MEIKGTLLLKRSELEDLMNLDDYIKGIENAFKMHGEGNTFGTGMIHGDTPGDVEFHIKVGGLKLGENSYFGLKINGSSFTNMEKYGLPNIMGAVILFDAEKAIPVAIVDAGAPTVKRTGAATAVAAKYLARKDSKILTVCGTGTQGKIQLEAILKTVPHLEKVYAFNRNYENAKIYAREMRKKLGLDIDAAQDLSEIIPISDIIITCTPSKEKYIMKELVKAGTFISAIGADSPDKQEIDEKLLVHNKVVCDIIEQCVKAGELHHAIENNLIKTEDVHAELGQVIAGIKKGRENDEEIIIFDATGTALQDTAAAALCYEKAIKKNMGTYINFFD